MGVYEKHILTQLKVYQLLALCHTYLLSEHTHCLRGITTTTDTADGRHTRIIPAAYEIVLFFCLLNCAVYYPNLTLFQNL